MAIQRSHFQRRAPKKRDGDLAFSMAMALLFIVACAFGLRWVDHRYGIQPAQAQEIQQPVEHTQTAVGVLG